MVENFNFTDWLKGTINVMGCTCADGTFGYIMTSHIIEFLEDNLTLENFELTCEIISATYRKYDLPIEFEERMLKLRDIVYCGVK